MGGGVGGAGGAPEEAGAQAGYTFDCAYIELRGCARLGLLLRGTQLSTLTLTLTLTLTPTLALGLDLNSTPGPNPNPIPTPDPYPNPNPTSTLTLTLPLIPTRHAALSLLRPLR